MTLKASKEIAETPGTHLLIVLLVSKEELIEERCVRQRESGTREEESIDLRIQSMTRTAKQYLELL